MFLLIISIAKFLVTPASIEVIGSKTIQNGEIEVFNADDVETLRIKCYPGSFYVNIKGEIEYPKKDTLKNSCARWIHLNPSEVSLPPKEKIMVRYSVTIPEINEEHWCSIFFEAVNIPEVWTPVIISPRIGISFYVLPTSIQSLQADIQSIFLKDGLIHFTLKNEGNIKLRPKIWYELKEMGKDNFVRDSILGGVIFPNYERIYTINRFLKKGSYYFTVEIDYGGSEIIKGEKIFDIR